MRIDKIRKYLLPNIPYLFFLWCCIKLGTAYCFAAGAGFRRSIGHALSRCPKMRLSAGDYLCFEEDSRESIVLRELLDKKLWGVPERIKDKVAFEENINKSIREYNPDYWQARQVGLEKAPIRQTIPARSTER